MPRLKDDKYGLLKRLLMGGILATGKTRDEIASYMKISTHTLQKRLEDPSQLTLGNVSDLAWILAIPIDSIRSAIPR